MADIDRRRFVQGTGMAGLAALAGCAGGSSSDAAAQVAMVYATGGLDDGSFNDQAQQGLNRAKDELDVSSQDAQPEAVSDFPNVQRQFAESSDPEYDLVCSIGFLQKDALTDTSSDFPDQQFMIVDEVVDNDNVASYTFREHEGSYLVGILAGTMTGMDFSAGAGQTNTDASSVGFVGGVEGELIGRFEAGFKAGVASVDSEIEVQTTYTGNFDSPTDGREAADAMYNNGADVVYHAAGNTGTGVFRAAQEQGRFAIGVDRDQSVTRESFSDVILASMVKRVDTAVFEGIESVVNDEFDGGSAASLGLAEEGVDAVYGQSLGEEIPQSVKDQISSARSDIVDGNTSVPTNPDNV